MFASCKLKKLKFEFRDFFSLVIILLKNTYFKLIIFFHIFVNYLIHMFCWEFSYLWKVILFSLFFHVWLLSKWLKFECVTDERMFGVCLFKWKKRIKDLKKVFIFFSLISSYTFWNSSETYFLIFSTHYWHYDACTAIFYLCSCNSSV